MKVFKGEKVVITPRDLGQLRDADLVFMDLLSTLDHHRPQGQKFVAIVVVALGIGQGAPAPALGDLVEGHAVRASARSPMTWTVKPELARHRPEAAVRQARQHFELVVGRFGGLKGRNKDGSHRRHDQLSEENHVDS